MNYIDIIIIVVIIGFSIWGYFRGGIREAYTLGSFLLSIFVATVSFGRLFSITDSMTFLPKSYLNAIVFFGTWLAVETLFFFIYFFFSDKLPQQWHDSLVNRIVGITFAFIKISLFVWFLFLFVFMLPLSQGFSATFKQSAVGNHASKNGRWLISFVDKNFGGIATKAAESISVSPDDNKIIKLGFTSKASVNNSDEAKKMLNLINQSRKEAGRDSLVMDTKLTEVALGHGREMLTGGFLSHLSTDGSSPFERLNKKGINYFYAGENLAIAPDMLSAFNALMASPGHRANIMSGEYKKVGIAAIDAGTHGKVYIQEFTD